MRRDYFSKLSRAARWYLPPAEAEEVLEDYREIVEGRTEEELRRDLGAPRAAMRQLAEPKAYRQWVMVFGILAACLLFSAADALLNGCSLMIYRMFRRYSFFWGSSGSMARLSVAVFPFCVLPSSVWFRRKGGTGRGLSKRVIPLFVLVLLGMVWVWFLFGLIMTERTDVIDFLFPHFTWTVLLITCLNIVFGVAAGMAGLFKARLEDRRWQALYVWSLTGVVLNTFLWQCMTNMNFSEGWQVQYWIRLAFITLVGLAGTGVSLC